MRVMQRLRKCWLSHTRQTEQYNSPEVQSNIASAGEPISPSLSSSLDTIALEKALSVDDGFFSDDVTSKSLPISQSLLRLHAVGQEFDLIKSAALPELTKSDELLVQVNAVGLNPIDWKAPAFGWGLPSLPCVLGRDFVGTIVKTAASGDAPMETGSIVGVISTDYRDYRKAAFQEYVVAPQYNMYRIPKRYGSARTEIASLGVAFVTAALAFGVCLGGRMGTAQQSVDLLSIARSIPSEILPQDIRDECANPALRDSDTPQKGDWILIWGGGSTVGFILVQLAKLAGLKVICVADAIKNGSSLVDAGADVIVHRANLQEALKTIEEVMKGKELRYGIDTVGKETSSLVQLALRGNTTRARHIVGLVGLPEPREIDGGLNQHKVPIKLFHEAPAIGKAVMIVLEDLLQRGSLIMPTVHVHEYHGLEGINSGLQLLRSGVSDAQRIVVPIT